jgi:hypothetical protein
MMRRGVGTLVAVVRRAAAVGPRGLASAGGRGATTATAAAAAAWTL